MGGLRQAALRRPAQVLAYLARYTHRVAIANSRLVELTDDARPLPLEGLSRRRPKQEQGHDACRRRVHPPLPDARAADGFHRIRHYGLFARAARRQNIARARELLAASVKPAQFRVVNDDGVAKLTTLSQPCPCCGGRMIVIETFNAAALRAPFQPNEARFDTS